jgi:hypothetical protein
MAHNIDSAELITHKIPYWRDMWSMIEGGMLCSGIVGYGGGTIPLQMLNNNYYSSSGCPIFIKKLFEILISLELSVHKPI